MVESVFPLISKKLLPIKAHYFLFNIAIGPFVTNIPIIARQKGFSSTVVGVLLTGIFLIATIAKPICGWLADRFKMHKFIFIALQGITALTFFSIFFIPSISNQVSMKSEINNTEIHFCPENPVWDNCLHERIHQYKSKVLKCQLNCKSEPWMKRFICLNRNEMDCISDFDSFKYDILIDVTTIRIDTSCLTLKEFKNSSLTNDYSTHSLNLPLYAKLFEINCEVTCEDDFFRGSLANRGTVPDAELIEKFEFWLFCGLLLIGYAACSAVGNLADTICFDLLGDDSEMFGKQRLWDSIGSGIVAFFIGIIIDYASGNAIFKDYTVVYFLCLISIGMDMMCSMKLEYTKSKISESILKDVGKLFKSIKISTFFCWCCFAGFFSAIIFSFVFWHLEVLTDQIEQNECGQNYVKTLEGIDMFVQTCIGEIPFFFWSGYIIKKIGHINCMHLIFAAFAIRFFYYSTLSNPWWILPIEVLNGVTFALLASTMPSYVNLIAPPGAKATLQGFVGALYEGIGISSGNFAGGTLFKMVGGSKAFFIIGITATSALAVYILIYMSLNLYERKCKKVSNEIAIQPK